MPRFGQTGTVQILGHCQDEARGIPLHLLNAQHADFQINQQGLNLFHELLQRLAAPHKLFAQLSAREKAGPIQTAIRLFRAVTLFQYITQCILEQTVDLYSRHIA